MWKFYDLLKAHSEYFVVSDPTAIFSNTANDSKWFRETILSAIRYGRYPAHSKRLRLVGGREVRADERRRARPVD
jgi:hypothetical protein